MGATKIIAIAGAIVFSGACIVAALDKKVNKENKGALVVGALGMLGIVLSM